MDSTSLGVASTLPTIIADVSLDDALWKEEVFGPVEVLNKSEERAELVIYWGSMLIL
jgi:acyl-CoA reductase-like NAD-dependent aldehyde dehydrogenase